MRRILLLCLILIAAVSLVAQDTMKVPKYLWIEEPTLATGKHLAFEKLIGQMRDVVVAEKADMYWVAGSPITGGLRQVTFLTFHDSFASIEKMLATMHKVEGALMMKNANFAAEAGAAEIDAKGIVAKFREDLSLNPTKVPLGETRYWLVMTVMLKPGMMAEYGDFVKQQRELLTKADPEYHFLCYQVLAGVPGPAFFVVRPLKSLADLDKDNSAAYDAVFTPLVTRQLEAIRAKTQASVMGNILVVNPQLSHVPEAVMAANPAFWTVKESTPAMPAKMKKMKKTAEAAK